MDFEDKQLNIGNLLARNACMFSALLSAELLVRLYKVLHERFFYKDHYLPAGRLACIIKSAFTFNAASRYFIFVGLTLTLSCYGLSLRFLRDMGFFAPVIPLYCLCRVIGSSDSTLDYAELVREPHGLDYGAGMASNYWHGFLYLTMPAHTKEPGIRQRIDEYAGKHDVVFALKRLVILIPDKLYTRPKIESEILEQATPLKAVMKNRIGVLRPYVSDVYRFTEPMNKKFYYVVVEGATPLTSFFETMNHGPSTTWQMKEMQRELLLKFYNHLKELLKWPETQHEVELVFYCAATKDGHLADIGHVLLKHITSLWDQETKSRSKLEL